MLAQNNIYIVVMVCSNLVSKGGVGSNPSRAELALNFSRVWSF